MRQGPKTAGGKSAGVHPSPATGSNRCIQLGLSAPNESTPSKFSNRSEAVSSDRPVFALVSTRTDLRQGQGYVMKSIGVADAHQVVATGTRLGGFAEMRGFSWTDRPSQTRPNCASICCSLGKTLLLQMACHIKIENVTLTDKIANSIEKR